ncbi:exosortase A [Candidatus Nitrospira neomarina]|uniref:Exosortase A n=1 Tax=Candidatus Nitrospira neomarina TaxID=3020899 RepID=A0AA96GRM5_9BACT|nr:exosortase A [Candidatus Nitrospira neomarina]WNM64038.1 exosortase A [Candidatus Nitrospira neomarina]
MQTDSTPYSPVPTGRFRSSEWAKVLGHLLIGWAALLGLYFQTAFSLVETWSRSDTYGHGFLILPLSGYLVWRERHRLATLVPRPNSWALLLLGGSAGVWLLGHLTSVVVVQQFAWVTMVAGMVWALAGTKITKVLLFPLAFLFFAVPVGADLVPPLQDFTAFFTVNALQVSGIPVFWEGRYITTPSGRWHVAEACAGVRYLISGATMGVFFAGVVYRSWTRRVVFVLFAVLALILANGMRAYGITLLGYLVDHELAASADHILYGWVFFSVVMFLLFWVGLAMREPEPSLLEEKVRASSVGEADLPSQGEWFRRSTQRRSFARMAKTAGCGVGVVALAPLCVMALSPSPPTSLGPSPFSLVVSSPWHTLSDYAGNWTPHFEGADTVLTRTYTDGHRQVHLFLAVYFQQQQGRELVSQTNSLIDGDRWELVSESRRETLVENFPLTVKESHLRSEVAPRLVWSWYWLGGHMTSNAYMAKLLHATAYIFGGATEGAVIAIAADYSYSSAEAVNVIEDFLQHTSFLQATNSSPKA